MTDPRESKPGTPVERLDAAVDDLKTALKDTPEYRAFHRAVERLAKWLSRKGHPK